MAVRIVRWKAAAPLVVCATLIVAIWLLFSDGWLRAGIEAGGTAALGARVELASAHLSLARGQVTLRGLVVASPQDSFKNLLQSDELTADVAVLPLLEKKLVIDRLAATGLQFGTPRATNGIVPSTGPGIVAATRAHVGDFATRVHVPVLQLATGKVRVADLDPSKLATPQAATVLGARADSVQRALERGADSLALGPVVDTAQAVVARLRTARPTDLAAVNAARRALDDVKRASDRLAALEHRTAAGAAQLQAGVAGLDSSRRRDEALAQSLVQLPPTDAASVGAALFGPATVGKAQRALYYLDLARTYMPPGLRPHPAPGPRRLRRAGTTVRFPREHDDPGFLLKQAELSFALAGDSGAARDYHGTLAGLTSDPALYGRPATFAATAPGAAIGALLDHVHPTAHDTLAARVGTVRLTPLAVPGLPFRLDPGRGSNTVAFALTGDSLRAQWAFHSGAVRWARDSGGGGALGDLVWHALSGITTLDLSAEITGPIAHPTLAVHSNLDDALAARLRAVLGDQATAAARGVRSRADSVADAAIGPARVRATAATADVQRRLADQRAKLDRAKADLEQRLKQLTGGLVH